jgi:chromosome segregation ATPase
MSLSVTEIIAIITIVGMLIERLYQGRKLKSDIEATLSASRKSNADADTAQATAIKAYADAAAVMSEINAQNQGRMNAMGERVDELTKLLDLRNKTVSTMQQMIDEMTEQLGKRDKRIKELETQAHDQNEEITRLRNEIKALQDKQ